MANYSLSDYGRNPHAGKARNNASARGWGSGWPDCAWDRMQIVERAGVRVSVRQHLAPLVAALFSLTEKLGYDILAVGQGRCGGTWGMACRAIRGTSVASNHSWGLAIDINAPCNPMGDRFVSDIPPKVVHAWEACGFYWGGRYSGRPDAMHFEYIGRPQDVKAHLRKALRMLEGDQDVPDGGGGGTGGGGGGDREYGKFRKDVDPGDRTLNQWDAGRDVKFVQAYIGSDKAGKADGYFGPKTERGVKWYQDMRGIKVDGIVGPQTWRHILGDDTDDGPEGDKGGSGKPTIKRGDRNAHVREVQRVLNAWYPTMRKLAVDGIFGRKTAERVRYAQRRLGIRSDGIVGPVTWNKLGF